MNAREPRRNVVINSRMRCGATWRDASILNISSRGLGLHAPAPPERGSYVEVRRGAHVIIARVVWVNGSRFGLHTQDAVPIESIVSQPAISNDASEQQTPRQAGVERRSAPRAREREHEASRFMARAIEFACVASLGASAAFAGFATVKEAIGRPLAHVQIALAK